MVSARRLEPHLRPADLGQDSIGSRGVTLIELLVVLAVLAVMAGLVGLTWRPDQWTGRRPEPGSVGAVIAAARHQALRAGKAVTASVAVGVDSVPIIALPDGRVIGAERLGVDPLSGALEQHR